MKSFNDFKDPDVEENPQLIQDLRHLYPAHTTVEESITRIKQQLFVISENTHGIQTSRLQQGVTLPTQLPYNRKKLHFPTHTNHSRYYRLNAIAAIVFVTLLVGSLAALFTLFHRNTSVGTPPVHYPDAGISTIQMINQTTGWAFSGNGVILRTTDGGVHWQDVSPIEAHQQIFWGITTIIDATAAWIIITPNKTQSLNFAPTSSTYIFRTTDAGHSWQKTTIQTAGDIADKLVFQDAQDGWLLTKLETQTHIVTGPEHISPPELFRTTDGGKTWTKILNSSGAQAHQFNDMYITGIGFANAQTGWITGTPSNPNNATARLFVTHDAGATWQQQTLPQIVHHTPSLLWPPQFFTAQDGVLPAVFAGSAGIDIYVTHDGGTTWKSTNFLNIKDIESMTEQEFPQTKQPNSIDYGPKVPPFILDMQHWWIVGYEGITKTMFTTNDGGQHWTSIKPIKDPAPDSFGVPDFSSSSNGWILNYSSDTKTNTQHTVLFQTTDGGHSWEQVHAIFPSFIVPKSAF